MCEEAIDTIKVFEGASLFHVDDNFGKAISFKPKTVMHWFRQFQQNNEALSILSTNLALLKMIRKSLHSIQT